MSNELDSKDENNLKSRVIRCKNCNHFTFVDDCVTYCTFCFHSVQSRLNVVTVSDKEKEDIVMVETQEKQIHWFWRVFNSLWNW